MIPTETLKHEHDVILLVLEAVEREARAIRHAGKANAERVGKMIDFIRNFADKCHHAKEEKLLFVRLEQRGIPRDGGPIGVMLAEHEKGRAHARAVAEALPKAAQGERQAAQAVADNLMGYVLLLRAHIDKEDNVLYPMGNRVLTEEDQRSLAEAFEKVEAEDLGEGVHEKYHQLARELAEL
ncbi:MAG TPA: hemerythrin domain-containing protein [Candidatus Hydrogenedentes bacterium]|nr:hemerythrin domain-containing protein [Candidatus Hydrogenedentota bacterium]